MSYLTDIRAAGVLSPREKCACLEFPETKTSLLLRIQNPRDEEAWREFVAIYRPVVYRLARMRELQHADADDLSQRVVIAVQRAIGNWQLDPTKGRFRFWLARIAQNAIINALARRPPDAAVGGSSVHELLQKHPLPDHDTQQDLQREYRRSLFRRAAQRILPEFRDMDGTATASTSLVATTLAVTSSASDPAIGQPITYTATVSAADSSAVNGGTVDFYDEASGTDLGTAAVVGGVATFTTTSELAGPNAVGCTFGGDGNLDTSNSTVNGDVGPAPVIDVSGAGEVNKGAITTISASVANLHGLPFRVLVNWGGNQGSPDTVAYPPGTTGFSLAHQYVDADGQAFDIAYTVGITVESLDGTVVYAQTSTSIQGTDPGESVNVINSVPFITVGTPVTLTAVVADPGENDSSYTYAWDVWPSGGTPLQPGSGSTYTFTPDQDATYNWRLDVTDTDGVTTEVGNAIANSAASGGTWQPDTPSVTIQQCDADGNPTAAPVIGGNTAYFKVSVSGNMPDQGNVVVYYRTTDGGAQGGIDYVPTGGSSKTLYYNGSGYSPWIISIQTIASPDQVVGNLVLSGWCYDADAKVPTAPTFSVQCTVQQSWWSATDTWSMATATGVYTGHVVAHGNPTLPDLAKLITGDSRDWIDLLKTNTFQGTLMQGTDAVPNGTVIDVSPLLQDLESSLRKDVVNDAVPNLKNAGFSQHGQQYLVAGMPLDSTKVNSYFTGTPFLPLDCKAAVYVEYEKALLDVIGNDDVYNALFANQTVPIQKVTGTLEKCVIPGELGWDDYFYVYTGKAGDWDYTKNIDAYNTYHADGNYFGENVTCVAPGSSTGRWASAEFFGYPIGTKTYPGWSDYLIQQYNKGLPLDLQMWFFNDFEANGGGFVAANSKFINVASVGLQLFNYRNKPRPFAAQ